MVKQYSAEFKIEAAKMVVDHNYSVAKAAQAMGVSLAALNLWVKKLRLERQGQTPAGLPLTREQIELREMKKKIQRFEMKNEILKKATALLMSDSLKDSR